MDTWPREPVGQEWGSATALEVEVRRQGPYLMPWRFGRFGHRDMVHEVAEVVDWWPGADHRYYKVRTTEDELYILRYDLPLDEWEIVYFKGRSPSACAC